MPPAGSLLLPFILATCREAPSVTFPFSQAHCRGAPAPQEHTAAGCPPLSGRKSAPCIAPPCPPDQCPHTVTGTTPGGVPSRRPHGWCVVELAWPMKPWLSPSPGWDLQAALRELADVRVGLAHPVWHPGLAIGRDPSLYPGCWAHGLQLLDSRAWVLSHLASPLTCSMMALHTREGLPLGQQPGTEQPWSGQALPRLRPPHSSPPPAPLWAPWQQPPLVGSVPAPHPFLPAGREELFLAPFHLSPSHPKLGGCLSVRGSGSSPPPRAGSLPAIKPHLPQLWWDAATPH